MKRGTPEHPKTSLLMSILRVRRYVAVGILESLWHFTMRYAPRGDIGRWTDEAIASAMDWPGDAAKLIGALVDSGWLDASNVYRLLVHDWHNHSDQTTQRYLAKQKLAFASTELARASSPVPVPVAVPAPVPVPIKDSSEPPSNGDSKPPACVAMSFPVVGKGGTEWKLTQDKLEEYATTYPNLDVQAECRKARQWAVDNPSRRKTGKGMAAFLSNWLNRATNNGGARVSGNGQARPAKYTPAGVVDTSAYDNIGTRFE